MASRNVLTPALKQLAKRAGQARFVKAWARSSLARILRQGEAGHVFLCQFCTDVYHLKRHFSSRKVSPFVLRDVHEVRD